MTKTKRALAILADGSKTFTDFAEALELDEQEARSLIGYMQLRGYVQSVPISYALTIEGIERHQHKPSSSPEKIAQVHARNQRIRAESRIGSIFGSAKKARNSVFSLGNPSNFGELN